MAMGPLPPPAALRAQLESLGDAVGGMWFLIERTMGGLQVLAAPEDAAIEPDPAEILHQAEAEGVIVQHGVGRNSHPAGRGMAERDVYELNAGPKPLERILAGLRPDDAAGDPTTRSLLAIVLSGLSAVADAADQAHQDQVRADRLELRAATDPLTGLLNRRGWDRLLLVEGDRCARHDLDAEVIVVDLDGLKTVNDTEGHEAGDAMIVRAATFIFSAVRIHDSVARLGGDEFAVLAVGADGVAGTVGRRIEMALAEAGVAASVGWAARSERGSLADAWRAADLRMYRVKQGHRRARPRSVPDAQTLS